MRIYIIVAFVAAMVALFWQQHSELTSTRTALKAATTDLATCRAVSDSITASAASCRLSVDEGAALSAKRAKQAQAAVETAQANERRATMRATSLLKQRPENPDDLCRSTDVMLSDWIKNRKSK